MITNIAIFASGKGSNFKALLKHFEGSKDILICLLVTNNPHAGAIQIAENNNISVRIMDRKESKEPESLLKDLQSHRIDFLVLAGFLWKIPELLVENYRGRILNIHPALLPKFGGKGMYGQHVHEAVIANKEKTSGITIHLVDEEYDHGATLFQATCPVDAEETAETLSAKIHQLEHQYFPSTVEAYIKKQTSS